MDGIILAIIASVSWGLMDFLIKILLKNSKPVKTLLYIQAIGLIPIILYGTYIGIPLLSIEMLLLAIGSGILMTFGYLMFFKGIKIGNISIVAPVSSTNGFIVFLAGILIYSEFLSSTAIIGAITIIIGTILASFKGKNLKIEKGAKEAIIAAFGWALAFIILKPVITAHGEIIPILFMRLAGTIFIFGWSKIKSIEIKIPSNLKFISLIAMIDVIGFLAYSTAITTSYISIVNPIVASYPATTLILAYLFLKERVSKSQKLGIALILLGLVMISIV
jgi:drug/metabolite transporter (DMT)-like permease